MIAALPRYEQLDFWPLQFTSISKGFIPPGAVVESVDTCWIWYRVIM